MKSAGILYAPRHAQLDESARSVFLESEGDPEVFSVWSVDGLCLEVRSLRESRQDVTLVVVGVGGTRSSQFAPLEGAILRLSGESRLAPNTPLHCRAALSDGVTASFRLPGVERVSYR